jgi:hypothetical protein
MKTTVCALMIALWVIIADATTLSVALDGTQPYTSIQAAIDASADTDTVLVYPGRYYENIRFFGKNITLASMELVTGDPDYKYLTIIDGNNTNSVVQIRNGESNVTIRGFSIVNGYGFYDTNYGTTHGGGLLVGALSGQRRLSLINCVISDNYASSGGGMQIDQCYLTMSGVTIKNNKSSIGGGMFFAGSYTDYTSTFDPVSRCSIYSNYAAFGSDLYYYMVDSVHVIVDTFTVANPWNFYATAIPRSHSITNPYTFDIQHTVHEEVNHDLYVAPWGDDANSGLNASEPMSSVFMAMYRIASDINDPKTVHVANGHYTPSLNNQLFPVPVKSHTRLEGESREGTIFDAENVTEIMLSSAHSTNWKLMNVTLQNGKLGLLADFTDGIVIQDVRIQNLYDIRAVCGFIGSYCSGSNTFDQVSFNNVTSPRFAGIIYMPSASGNLTLNGVSVSNSRANEYLMAISVSTIDDCEVIIDGCRFHDNYNYSPDVFNTMFQISPFDDYGTRLRIEMRNSAFYDNHQSMPAQMGMARSLNDTLFIENCTFAGNSGGSGTVMVQGTSVLTNNIFWNPAMSTQVWIPNYTSSGIMSHTTLNYNNILGGMNGVYNATSQNPLVWGPGNTAYDPLFALEGNAPYTLGSDSPLIDAGWQYASGLSEPAWDAGGNERVLDGDGDGIPVVDPGAYEYQPLAAPVNLNAEQSGANVYLNWEMPAQVRSLAGYRVFRDGAPYADVLDPGLMSFRDHITQTDTLSYRVAALYGNVESVQSNEVTVCVEVVGDGDETAVPGAPALALSPNPFRERVEFRLELTEASPVRLEVYNLKGEKVRVLVDGPQGRGTAVYVWDGRDTGGNACGSGIYFYRLTSPDINRTGRVVLVK